jgi:hypothetical protein
MTEQLLRSGHIRHLGRSPAFGKRVTEHKQPNLFRGSCPLCGRAGRGSLEPTRIAPKERKGS